MDPSPHTAYPRCVSLPDPHAPHRSTSIYTNADQWYMPSSHTVAPIYAASVSSLYAAGTNRTRDHHQHDYPSPVSSGSDPSPKPLPHQQLEQLPQTTYPTMPSEPTSPQFTQVESSIGPTRSTRRQSSLKQGLPERRASFSSSYTAGEQEPSLLQPPIQIQSGSGSRTDSPPSDRHCDRGPLHSPSPHMGSTHLQPIHHPGTPTSMPSPYSPYEHARRSRTRSAGYFDLRPHSPTLSTVSSLTHSSRALESAVPAESSKIAASKPPPREKHKKHRLRDVDRKNICIYHLDNPNARQEDIGAAFSVERSTISKILKEKDKWLNISEEDECDQTAKHRPSKFPEIEDRMLDSLQHWTDTGMSITDHLIRTRALDIAKEFGINQDRFKGSSGWIENFKHRHDIRRGEWLRANRDRLRPMYHPPPLRTIPIISPYDQRVEANSQYKQSTAADTQTMHTMAPSHQQWPERPHESVAQPSQPASIVIDPSLQQVSAPTSLHEQHHPVQPTYAVSYSQPLYGPGVAVPNSHPTLADAEEAINIVITFVDSQGKGILKDDERSTLNDIKCALFQAASGLEYERPR